MTATRRTHTSLAALLVLAGACSQTPITATVRTFNRPVQAAFVCLETATGNARSLADCTPDSSNVAPSGLATHALVLQEARGEVASVDLAARTVIDTDPAVPGYSFVAVDPLPTAIIVPPTAPSCAFVASAGADTIEALDLRLFRRESARSAEARAPLTLPGAPSAMVLDPSELALWVAMPERSSVARVEISGCDFGALEEIALDALVPPGAVAPPSDDAATSRYCPVDFGAAPLPTLAPRDVAPLEPVARPSVLAIGRELLVGDRALPLIHRVDLVARVPLAPLSVGATVRSIAVSPEVPVSYDPGNAERARFGYAVDDGDGTILAVDYGATSPTFGAVLPIGAGSSERPDRVPFLVGARTLEVIRPQYDELEPLERVCDPADISDDVAAPSFATLRGVFLVAGMNDATVRFVDVFDSDAPCRGRVEGADEDCTSTSEPWVYVRRHHPRIGERRATVGVVASDVSFLVNGATVRLTDASVELDRIDCPAPLRPIFGADTAGTSGLVCGHADPFEAVPEIWQAAWQGAISGTASSTGNFDALDASTVVLDARVDFCAAGALGADDLAGAPRPEGGFSGDVIAITTTLTEAMSENERCQALVGLEGSNQSARPVLVPIRSASTRPDGLREPYRGRLYFDADAPVLDRVTPGLTLADVRTCFGDELVRFDVRTRGSFSVTGSRSGQRHRVVRGADGSCEVDASLSPTRQARAAVGSSFVNDLVAFRIPSVPTTDSTELRVTIGTVPATLNIDVGASTGSATRSLALPSDLVWNEVTQRLYVVDVERRGLIELSLQPLMYTQSTFQ